MLFSLPNVLSLSRVVLALPCTWALIAGHWIAAGLMFAAAIGTDLADGWLARRTNRVTPLGGLFDHASDAAFVTIQLGAWAALDITPWLLVFLVPASFVQYMLDSDALAGAPLRASRIGRSNGIAYFVLAGFPLYQNALSLPLLPDVVFFWAGWFLICTTLVSMGDRLWAYVRIRSDRLSSRQ